MAYLHLDLGPAVRLGACGATTTVSSTASKIWREAGPSDGLRFYSFRLFLGEHKRRLARDGEVLRGRGL